MVLVAWMEVDGTGGRVEVVKEKEQYKTILNNKNTGYTKDMTGWTSRKYAIHMMHEVHQANVWVLNKEY